MKIRPHQFPKEDLIYSPEEKGQKNESNKNLEEETNVWQEGRRIKELVGTHCGLNDILFPNCKPIASR